MFAVGIKVRVMVVSGRGEGSLILLLEHTTTLRANTLRGYRGLTENKKGIEWFFIDEGSHCCSGNSKRIRLRTSMLPGLLYILKDKHV